MYFVDCNQNVVYNAFTNTLLLADIQGNKIVLRHSMYKQPGGRLDHIFEKSLSEYNDKIETGQYINLGKL